MSMEPKPDEKALDARLQAAFGGLQARPDFDARLFARINAEAQNDAAQIAERARRLEQERYGAARQEVSTRRQWGRSIGRFVTLETVGIIALVGGVAFTVLPQAQLRTIVPVAFTILGLLAAFAPMILEEVRGTIPRTPVTFNRWNA